jgi:hypothetical protein
MRTGAAYRKVNICMRVRFTSSTSRIYLMLRCLKGPKTCKDTHAQRSVCIFICLVR